MFCEDEKHYDFSKKAELEAFFYETRGEGQFSLGVMCNDERKNGYIVGKHWMDVTIRMWREDIKRGVLKKKELYQDPEFQEYHWWLDKVLRGVQAGISYITG